MTTILSHSFAYSARADARVLILGTMPGRKSLQEQQYYAHQRNLFWPFMQALFGIEQDLPYLQRLDALNARGIALWDVLKHCQRPDSSLDQHIIRSSEQANDLAGFCGSHQQLQRICLNGGKAGELFKRHVRHAQSLAWHKLEIITLPSTSPANAGQKPEWKLNQWRKALAGIAPTHDNGGPKLTDT